MEVTTIANAIFLVTIFFISIIVAIAVTTIVGYFISIVAMKIIDWIDNFYD